MHKIFKSIMHVLKMILNESYLIWKISVSIIFSIHNLELSLKLKKKISKNIKEH